MHSAEESPLFRSRGARREGEEENGVRPPWEDRRLVMNCSKKRGNRDSSSKPGGLVMNDPHLGTKLCGHETRLFI